MASTFIQSGSLWLAAMPVAIWVGLFLGSQIMRRYSPPAEGPAQRPEKDGQIEWAAALVICLLLGFFLSASGPGLVG